jgi:hypothetical protein
MGETLMLGILVAEKVYRWLSPRLGAAPEQAGSELNTTRRMFLTGAAALVVTSGFMVAMPSDADAQHSRDRSNHSRDRSNNHSRNRSSGHSRDRSNGHSRDRSNGHSRDRSSGSGHSRNRSNQHGRNRSRDDHWRNRSRQHGRNRSRAWRRDWDDSRCFFLGPIIICD